VGKDRSFDDIEQRRRDRWNFLFIAGMWFQTCSTTIFAAPSSASSPTPPRRANLFLRLQHGVGWRNIIEKMHMTATLTKWYEERGRHEIFAGGKTVPLASLEHSLVLRQELVTTEEQHDLDRWASPRTLARKRRARATPGSRSGRSRSA